MKEVANQGIRTQEIEVNFGPHHPSTHGVFRMVLTLDGENVHKVNPHIGYLHRGIEKLAEKRTYAQCVPFTDRLDYICSMTNNLAYVQTVEQLLDLEVPTRAEYIRVIVSELQRIINHCIFWATFGNDLGSQTALMYGFRDREMILDVFEELTGSRMTYSYMRVGGIAKDISDEQLKEIERIVDYIMDEALPEYHNLITGNEIFQARTKDIGILKPETAIDYGVTGPNLRASGVEYDVRKDQPYGIYDQFDFDVPTRDKGDTYSRYIVRLEEIEQSCSIIKQALNNIPEGKVQVKRVPKRPPDGSVYSSIESPKGELGFYLVSDGSKRPYRFRVRPPTFIHLMALEEMMIGEKVADAIVILGSIDIVLGEVDR